MQHDLCFVWFKFETLVVCRISIKIRNGNNFPDGQILRFVIKIWNRYFNIFIAFIVMILKKIAFLNMHLDEILISQ